jgi:hypothetical protein
MWKFVRGFLAVFYKRKIHLIFFSRLARAEDDRDIQAAEKAGVTAGMVFHEEYLFTCSLFTLYSTLLY